MTTKRIVRPPTLEESLQRSKEQRVRIRRVNPNEYLTTSRSNKMVVYSLHIDPDGRITCSCMGYSRYGVCKHAGGLRRRLQREQKQFDRL